MSTAPESAAPASTDPYDGWPPIPTPFLALDGQRLRRNVTSAQRYADAAGVALRPHAKTHKMLEVAALQRDAGAVGLTVATLGESEVFSDGGFDDLFVAYPVAASEDLAARVRSLAERAPLVLGLDSRAGADLLAGRGLARVDGLRLRVEVDCGLRRTGVLPQDAGRLAAYAARLGFAVDGVFTFPGHGYAPGAGARAAADEAEALEVAAEAFAVAGLECPVRSGGATPTYRSTDGSVVTETRPGVYAFADAGQVALGNASLDDVALTVAATVVSVPAPGRFVIDAGSKVLASDKPAYVAGHGLVLGVPGARLERIWEHHGVVEVSGDPSVAPAVGDRVSVVPNHVCTAINLADRVHVRDGGTVTSWAVAARGRNA